LSFVQVKPKGGAAILAFFYCRYATSGTATDAYQGKGFFLAGDAVMHGQPPDV
jgi:hypothetical protein